MLKSCCHFAVNGCHTCFVGGLHNNIVTNTRIPMITRTTSNSVNEKALKVLSLKALRFKASIIHSFLP